MRKLIIVSILLLFALALCGCAENAAPADRWQLTQNITAQFEDDGRHGYILKVEGSGAMPDYDGQSGTPWYGRAGRVSGIEIAENITYVGSYTFEGCTHAEYVILPQSVTKIGQNAFNASTTIFAYSAVDAEGAKVYTYSQNQPSAPGNYWHMVGSTPTVWTTFSGMSVLFVGNSFTYYNDLPALFAELCDSAGVKISVDSVTQGSHTLTKFADEADAYGAQVAAKLNANSYDAVILQEQSTRPVENYSYFAEAVATLSQKIESTQGSDCKIYLYQTWGFEAGLTSTYPTITDLEGAIRTAYENCAQATGATVSYAGRAFSYVYANHTSINLYNADGRHPSYEGSYLAACVHAATIAGIDPRTATYCGSLSADVASTLQTAAYNTVFGA